jgi:hypothetical protein
VNDIVYVRISKRRRATAVELSSPEDPLWIMCSVIFVSGRHGVLFVRFKGMYNFEGVPQGPLVPEGLPTREPKDLVECTEYLATKSLNI